MSAYKLDESRQCRSVCYVGRWLPFGSNHVRCDLHNDHAGPHWSMPHEWASSDPHSFFIETEVKIK
jgi:hypothetical protein